MQVRSCSPGSQERKKSYSSGNSSEANEYLQHANTHGVVTGVSYRVEGNRIYCLQLLLHTTVPPSLLFESPFQKRALNFLVPIFSPWFLVSSVITWHIFVCKHPTPCLSTCKWDKYYTEALVQMIVHRQIKIIKKKKIIKSYGLPGQMFLSLFLYCALFMAFKIYILSHSPLNQGNNSSPPAFCDINSFNPFLSVGTGNNSTLSASHHAKNIPFSFSKRHSSSPHNMSIILACLKHEQELTPDQNHLLYLWKWNTIKSKAVLSSVEKPRNLNYWEWVFPQRLPAEWRKLQIYSVIKITFFHYIFHCVALFFSSAVVFCRP